MTHGYWETILRGEMPATMPKSTRDLDDDLDSSVAKQSRILRAMRDHDGARYGDMALDRLSCLDSDSGQPRIEWTSYVPISAGIIPVKRGDPREVDVYKHADEMQWYTDKYAFNSKRNLDKLDKEQEEKAAEKKRRTEESNRRKEEKRAAKNLAARHKREEEAYRIAQENAEAIRAGRASYQAEQAAKKIQRQRDQHAFVDTRRRVVMKQFKISELEARVYIAICRDCFMWRGKPCPHCYREDFYSGGTAEYAILVRCRCQTPQVLHVDWRSIWDTAKQYPEEFGQWARDYVAPC